MQGNVLLDTVLPFFCGIAILSTAQGFMDPKVGEFFLVCSKKFWFGFVCRQHAESWNPALLTLFVLLTIAS